MKKAIIAVSFGTTHEDAERECIRPVEEQLRIAFPDREVFRAWTSRIIAKRMKARGVDIENETEVVTRLRDEGYESIVMASTHIIPGQEYDRLREVAPDIPVSAPLLSTDEDLLWMASLLKIIADEEGRTLLVMGHGTEHKANETYGRLRSVLSNNVKLACVEGVLSLDGIMDELKSLSEKRLTLMPLMLVSGDHAKNDLAGDGENSWKCRLQAEGFDIALRLQGLGALSAVQRCIVEKARAMCG